jgi:hypothetical protein
MGAPLTGDREIDLERLGAVAALEFFVLARIKAELDLEPPLIRSRVGLEIAML